MGKIERPPYYTFVTRYTHTLHTPLCYAQTKRLNGIILIVGVDIYTYIAYITHTDEPTTKRDKYMSRYKSHYKDRNKILEDKYQKEQRVPFHSRIDIKAAAECALYFKEKGVAVRSRSELIACAVEGLAKILRDNNKVVEVPSAEFAYKQLYHMGLGWEQGTRHHKRVLKVLQAEEIDLQSSEMGDITDDDMREAYRLYKKEMEKQKKDENAGKVAPIIPEGMRADVDEDDESN